MKLTVLGGAAAGGNPGQGCSGYLVQADGRAVVLDLGPGTLQELRLHTDFRLLDAILISHLHLDHVLDLLALRYALSYNPEPPTRKIPLWLPPGGLAFLDRMAAALSEDEAGAPYFAVYDSAEYDPNRSLDLGALTVRFQPTIHYVPCWAMRVSAGEPRVDLVYTADTGPAAVLVPFAANAALLVAEAGAVEPVDEPGETRGHLTAREARELAAAAQVARLLVTHYWAEQRSLLNDGDAAEVFAGPVAVATPGLTIEW